MGALSKSLAPFYNATKYFISTILPETLKLLVLTFLVLYVSYMRHCCKRKYTAMIDGKSPRFIYRRKSTEEESLECSICLSEFCDREEGRLLPCKHIFHKNCLDMWLNPGRLTCPLCRGWVLQEEEVWEYKIMQEDQLMDCCFGKELALMLLEAGNGRSCHGF